MQIKEMTLKNFKCLDNFETREVAPLQFGNLNVLAGENDSGKSSLLEAVQIFFGIKKIRESMFRDKGSEAIIQVKLNKIDKYIFNNTFRFRKWNVDYYEFFSQISEHSYFNSEDEYFKDWKIEGVGFLKYLEKLKTYSFYGLLKSFYTNYSKKFLINIEERFYLKDRDDPNNHEAKYEIAEEEEIEILAPEKYIQAEATSFFALNIKSKSLSDLLLSNKDFCDFMADYLKKFELKIQIIANEMLEQDKKFNFQNNGLFSNLKIAVGDKNDLPVFLYNYSSLVNFVIDSYSTNIFSNDNDEDILSKFAYNISIIINNRTTKKAEWLNEKQINISDYLMQDYKLAGNKLEGIDREFYDYKKDNTNILGSFIPISSGLEKSTLTTLPKPEVYLFDKEVVKDTIPKIIFENFTSYDNLKTSIYLALKYGIEAPFYGVQNTMEDGFNEHLLKIKENLKFLDENIENIEAKIGIKNFAKIMDYIEPALEIYVSEKVLEKNENILLTQKGQGFLRKLLLADFLTIIDSGKEEEEKESSNSFDSTVENLKKLPYSIGKILLLEEPELHLHPGAQRDLMKVLKNKLTGAKDQVFFTTHSSFILEELEYENIYVFKKDKNDKITRISDFKDKNKIKYLEAIQSSLGLRKTDLLSLTNLIVFVEGKRDKIILETLCERPDVHFNLNKTIIFPVEGQEKMRFYVNLALTEELLDLKTFAILDKNNKNLANKEIIIKDARFKLKDEDIFIIDRIDLMNYLDTEIVKKLWKLDENFTYNCYTEKLEDILENKLHKEIKDDLLKTAVQKTELERIDIFLLELLSEIDKRQKNFVL